MLKAEPVVDSNGNDFERPAGLLALLVVLNEGPGVDVLGVGASGALVSSTGVDSLRVKSDRLVLTTTFLVLFLVGSDLNTSFPARASRA